LPGKVSMLSVTQHCESGKNAYSREKFKNLEDLAIGRIQARDNNLDFNYQEILFSQCTNQRFSVASDT